MMIKKYIVDEQGNIIDKTKNKIIGNSNGVFIPDDGLTDIFYAYQINIRYYCRVGDLQPLKAIETFGTVID